MKRNKGLTSSIIIVYTISIIIKMSAFFRETLLAKSFGASLAVDAYLIALIVPSLFYESVGRSIGTTFIPILSEYSRKKNIEYTEMINNVYTASALLSLLITIVGIITAPLIVKLVAPGFDINAQIITVKLIRIMLPIVLFTSLSFLTRGFLQYNNEFTIPEVSDVMYNVVIIMYFITPFINLSIYGVAYTTTIATLLVFIIQLVFAYKIGLRIKIKLSFKNYALRKLIMLSSATFIGLAVEQINVIVDRLLASTLVEGSISALNYAVKLNGVVFGLATLPISTVFFPKLTEAYTKNDKSLFNKYVYTSIIMISIFTIPMSFGLIILRKEIVTFLFARGKFDYNSIILTSSALFFYSIGIFSSGLREILTRIYFSTQETKIPMINGIITVVINIILNLIFIRFMKHNGLALATSLSSTISIIFLFVNLKLKKEFYFLKLKSVFLDVIKIFIAASIMGISIYLFKRIIIINNNFLNVSLNIFVGMIIYFLALITFKIKFLMLLFDRFKKILY